MTENATTHAGGCLCGGVRYRIRGELRGVIACHCSQCRRTSGHYAAMTSAPSADIELTTSGPLRWYKSSDTAERGFCAAGNAGAGMAGLADLWRGNGAVAAAAFAHDRGDDRVFARGGDGHAVFGNADARHGLRGGDRWIGSGGIGPGWGAACCAPTGGCEERAATMGRTDSVWVFPWAGGAGQRAGGDHSLRR